MLAKEVWGEAMRTPPVVLVESVAAAVPTEVGAVCGEGAVGVVVVEVVVGALAGVAAESLR